MTMGDRIVVMKDGVIQQVGTPSEIYDNPTNLFVAGFIGTPQMNNFKVIFKASAKNAHITLPNGKEVSFDLKELKPIKDEYTTGEGHALVLGVRGEHIEIRKDKKGVEAEVCFVEILGNTTNLLCKLANSEDEFNVTIQERSSLQPGDKIHIDFKGENIHLFNEQTGRTIYTFDKEYVSDELETSGGDKDEK